MNESDLDRALAEGFGASSQHSVLRVIERITGEAPRILLRDADSESGRSPLIDPSSSEKRSIPQGRGSYQILGEIARGGMGVVMKGHDNDLGRDVALKVLHKELAKRPEVLQRFVEEAQIGGQLQHPGIVPVYELGLMADERPYFTMKLVKGRTLAALLAERKSPTVDRRRLLDVFESVCQTMAYAHSRGVIHRDLKPANVMVGAFGEVQVVDWGLAKVLRQGGTADEKRAKQTNISIIETVRSEPGSHGSHSLVGSVMGTPAYMSPEQARGEVEKLDEKSDVFSLGAILCEILTGAPPYLGESDKTLVEAASAKLDDASKRLDGCDADPELVALCRECLAPAQSARPRSAEVLAQRIHEYSISVEERARQAQVDAAEARVKAQEERRARKLTVGLAASVLVTVLVAGGGWAWMSSERARRERDTQTQVNAALNEATLKRGEGNWAEALAAVERAKGLADSGAASDELRARVASDLAAIESETTSARAKDELVRDNAALLSELADIRQPEGDTTYPTDWAKLDADHHAVFARHGFEIDERSPLDDAGALGKRGISVELAAALDEWAEARSRAGDKAGATSLSNLARRIDADPTRTELRLSLLASEPVDLKTFVAMEDLARLPATTLDLLGKALVKTVGVNEAIPVFRQAQQIHPGDFMLTMSLARALMRATPPRAMEAARYYTAALALRPASSEAAHELGRTLDNFVEVHLRARELFQAAVLLHPDDGHLRAHLAQSSSLLGDVDAALAMAREAILRAPKDPWAIDVLARALYDARDIDGAVACYRKAIALDPTQRLAFQNLGVMLEKQGDLDGAIEAFRNAIRLDPTQELAFRNLGIALEKHGDLDEAIEAFRKSIERDPSPAIAYYELGKALLLKGELDGAIAAERKAIELDPKYAWAYGNLGNALKRKGDHDGAIAAYRTAIALDPKYVAAFCNMGIALQSRGDFDGAITAEEQAIELDPKFADAYVDLGAVLNDNMHDHDGAIAAFRKAIDLDPKLSSAQRSLGVALLDKGELDAALAAERKAIDLDPKDAVAQSELGNVLQVAGDHAGAIDACRSAIQLDPRLAIAHHRLGYSLQLTGNLEEAIAHYREAIALEPKLPNLQFHMGNALQAAHDLDGAVAAWRRAIEVEPKSAAASNALAWLLATCADPARRDAAEAVRCASRAVELAPDAGHLNTLGAALCCAGEWGRAIEALDHSIRLPLAEDEFGQYVNAVNHCFLATAYAHLGEMDKARADFEFVTTWHAGHLEHSNVAETARLLDEARAAIEAGAKR